MAFGELSPSVYLLIIHIRLIPQVEGRACLKVSYDRVILYIFLISSMYIHIHI